MSHSYRRARVPYRRTWTRIKRQDSRFRWWRCPADGKRAYATRKEARRAARTTHPDDPTLAAYECPSTPGNWHYGAVDTWARDHFRRTG